MRSIHLRLALVVAAAVLGLTAAASADAAVRRDASGIPGAVSLSKVNGWAGQTWNEWRLNTLQIPGPVVYRARATRGNQRICVNRVVHKFIASTPGHGPNQWRFQDSWHTCALVRPGYRQRFRTWN